MVLIFILIYFGWRDTENQQQYSIHTTRTNCLKHEQKPQNYTVYTITIINILRPRRITPSEICLILHMPRKPNSLIVLLSIQNISQFKNVAKTCLPGQMLSSSSIAYLQVCPAPQIFSKQQMSPSELSSCCFCHVFSNYFVEFQLQFLLLKRAKCPPFFFTTKTTQPRPQVFSVNGALTCSGLHF